MPIVIQSVSIDNFLLWLSSQAGDSTESLACIPLLSCLAKRSSKRLSKRSSKISINSLTFTHRYCIYTITTKPALQRSNEATIYLEPMLKNFPSFNNSRRYYSNFHYSQKRYSSQCTAFIKSKKYIDNGIKPVSDATQSTQNKLIISYNKPIESISTSHEEAINNVASLNNASLATREEVINNDASSLNNEALLLNYNSFKESASWRFMDLQVDKIQTKMESYYYYMLTGRNPRFSYS